MDETEVKKAYLADLTARRNTLIKLRQNALETARDKLDMDSADAAIASPTSWDEEYNCSQCGVVIGNNASGLCLTCSDIAEHRRTHPQPTQ